MGDPVIHGVWSCPDHWKDARQANADHKRCVFCDIARLRRERRRDALDGQAALDEANNEIASLRRELQRVREAWQRVKSEESVETHVNWPDAVRMMDAALADEGESDG